MKKIIAMACLAALGSFVAVSVSAVEGLIMADLLNVRIQPDLKSSVAVKLDKGFKVEVVAETGEFYEIIAPITTPVYISAVYLNVDTTTAPLKMYAAGSTTAASYGVLPRDSKVKLIDIDRHGWAQIAPLADLRLFAAKRYVKLSAPLPAPKVEEKKEDAKVAEKVTEKKDETKPEEKPIEKKDAAEVTEKSAEKKDETKPAEKKEEPKKADEQVAPAMTPATEEALRALGVDLEKGRAATVTGTFLKLEKTTVPILDYVVMRNSTHEYFLCTDKLDFASFGAAQVTLKGRAFRVPGWRVPVMYVESVTATK